MIFGSALLRVLQGLAMGIAKFRGCEGTYLWLIGERQDMISMESIQTTWATKGNSREGDVQNMFCHVAFPGSSHLCVAAEDILVAGGGSVDSRLEDSS